jgi:hypothetical protein
MMNADLCLRYSVRKKHLHYATDNQKEERCVRQKMLFRNPSLWWHLRAVTLSGARLTLIFILGPADSRMRRQSDMQTDRSEDAGFVWELSRAGCS